MPRVVIAGGGVGAMEALLALRNLAGDRVAITVIAPDDRFTIRALTVAEPFAAGRSDVGAFPELVRAQGAEVRRTTVTSVDHDARIVTCADGESVPYDHLVLAPGARARAPFEHGLTFGLGDPLAINGLLADAEQGYTNSIAFVVPSELTWSLPLYELALLTASQVQGMGRDIALRFFTPEPGALGVFGPEAAAAVAQLFETAGIELHCGTPVAVGKRQVHLLSTGDVVEVERVVTLPILEGPRLAGVPADAQGFVPVDSYSRVLGLHGVYAIGDAADLLVKQGGLACQQADVAAAHIAHAVGADVPVEPLAPVLRGRLLTGRADRFMRRDLEAPHGAEGEEPLWWPPMKVAGRYLGPWLADHQFVRPEQARPAPEPRDSIDVEMPLGPMRRLEPDVLGMDPHGRMRDEPTSSSAPGI